MPFWSQCRRRMGSCTTTSAGCWAQQFIYHPMRQLGMWMGERSKSSRHPCPPLPSYHPKSIFDIHFCKEEGVCVCNGRDAMVATMCFTTLPSYAMEYWLANLVVALFTASKCWPLWVMVKDKSRIHWNFLLLCRIMAMGDNLSFLGWFSFISPQRTTWAYP